MGIADSQKFIEFEGFRYLLLKVSKTNSKVVKIYMKVSGLPKIYIKLVYYSQYTSQLGPFLTFKRNF